jgi:hypothetical protein
VQPDEPGLGSQLCPLLGDLGQVSSALGASVVLSWGMGMAICPAALPLLALSSRSPHVVGSPLVLLAWTFLALAMTHG